MKQVAKCELCGSVRGLELHHIIPVCAGGSDSENNLILICSGCHSKLTPTSELTKVGQHNSYFIDEIVFAYDFYKELDSYEGHLTKMDILDVFDKLTHKRRICKVKEK